MPEGKEKVERAREEGTKHLEFCYKIYMLQIEAGRYSFTSIPSQLLQGQRNA